MNWQEIIKPIDAPSIPPTQYTQNTQFNPPQGCFEDFEDIEHKGLTLKKDIGTSQQSVIDPQKGGSISRLPKKKASATIIPLKRGSSLALQWIEAHKEKLDAAGFTHNELYSQSLPIGVAHLKLWFKEDISVKLKDNTIIFTWRNYAGRTITQTCRPERHKTTTR